MDSADDFMVSCVCVDDQTVQIVPLVRRAAVMAQVKVAGDTVRSQQDCADVYSDMATVSSSAGESNRTFNINDYYYMNAVMVYIC